MTWQGEDRRKNLRRDDDDHDVLTKVSVNVTYIHENLKTFMDSFDHHVEEDQINFKEIEEKQNKTNRYIFIGIGILIAVEFFSKFVK